MSNANPFLPFLPPNLAPIFPPASEEPTPLPAAPLPRAPAAQLRASALAQAPTLGDEDAAFFLEFSDATKLGGKTKLIRLGVGAAAGLLVGALVGKFVL